MSLVFVLMTMAVVAVIAVVAVVVIYLAIRAQNPRTPHSVIAAPAQVVDIRELGTGSGMSRVVTFELSDGRQLELLATGRLVDQVRLGERGTVHWAGDRATGWVAELGGPQDSHRSE